jgi:hypothetical protein
MASPSAQGLHLMQLLHVLNNGQLVSRAEMILKLLVRLVFRRAGYQAQLCDETFLGRIIDHVVEHLLLVPPPPLDAELGIGDGEPDLRIFRPERRKAERGALVVRLLSIVEKAPV